MITRVLRGITALAGLILVLAGIPAALITLAGNPLPDQWPAIGELADLLTTQDTGQLFLGFLLWAAWAAWAYFTIAIVVEFTSQLTRRNWTIPVFSGGQRASAGLVAAVVAMIAAPAFTGVATAAADHSPATTSMTSSASTQTADHHNPVTATKQTPARERPAMSASTTQAKTTPYTVKADDSLWGIAERHYGDGRKFHLIAEANPQITDVSAIMPGQIIQLPPAVGIKPPPLNEATDYVVKNGDTLSGIAQEKLGNGNAWPKIAKANGDRVQPDGDKLSDPDVIEPGWHLTVPGAGGGTSAKPPVEAEDDKPSRPVDPKPVDKNQDKAETKPEAKPSKPPAVEPTVEPTEQVQPSIPVTTETTPRVSSEPAGHGGASANPDIVEAGFPVRTAGGAGVLLAAGLIGLLTARKTIQLLHRRPGQVVPVPQAQALTTEAQLRTIAEPLTADRLNLALRALASLLDNADRDLPQLSSVRMSDTRIDLHLRTPDPNPPAPFRTGPGATSWTINVDEVDTLLAATDAAATMPAPWPTLVTIGHDPSNSHVLVDLEQCAALAITTRSPVEARAVLAAITVELATSTWADDLRVTVVGALEELIDALGVGRIRYVDQPTNLLASLQRRADRHRTHLQDSGHTSLQSARLDTDSADALTPEVILLATDLTDAERDRLTQILTSLPRVAVAAVTATGDPLTEWNLRVTDPAAATLEPLGLQLRPQLLGGRDYDDVLELMSTAARTDTQPADWWDHSAETSGQPGNQPTADILDLSTAGRRTPQGSTPDATSPAEGDDSRTPGEVTPIRSTAQVVETAPLTGAWLQMLGPVEIHGATGRIEQARTEPCRRLAVFLALHPQGTPGAVIDDTLVITSSYRLSVLSRLRSWLGEAPDGEEYLPPAVGAKYRFHKDFRSDWDRYNDLTAAGINTTATQNLVDALKLIKGRPMSSGTPQLYSWASYHYDQISAKIRDTALQVAERSLTTHELDQARWAITTAHQAGLQHDEYLARAELRVERAAGNPEGIKTVVERLNHTVRTLETSLDPETLELMHQIDQTQRRNLG